MDLKSRNYKTVENLRKSNLREQRKLEAEIGPGARHGLEAHHKSEISALSQEQRKIQAELAQLRRKTFNTAGGLPPRKSGFPENYGKSVLDNYVSPTQRREGMKSKSKSGTKNSSVDNFASKIYENPTSRNEEEKIEQLEPVPDEKVEDNEPNVENLGAEVFNMDGTVRTMYKIPDFNERYEQATKARYIRHSEKNKPEFEKELSAKEVFSDLKKKK